mmetsp:Transcript_69138/g.212007  ORF Transcript_69138/g.212007 Transcript_69138/m.212007 type:complete len:203 (+) Transcript_69138:235-843(+)
MRPLQLGVVSKPDVKQRKCAEAGAHALERHFAVGAKLGGKELQEPAGKQSATAMTMTPFATPLVVETRPEDLQHEVAVRLQVPRRMLEGAAATLYCLAHHAAVAAKRRRNTLQGPAALAHSCKYDLAVVLELCCGEIQGASGPLHGRKHHVAVGLELRCGNLQGQPVLLHGGKHDVVIGLQLCCGKLQWPSLEGEHPHCARM